MSDNQEPEGDPKPNPWMKSLLVWGGIFLALLLVVQMVGGPREPAGTAIAYSDFRQQVAAGSVEKVQIAPGHVVACHLVTQHQTTGATGGTEAEHPKHQQGEVL